MAAMDIWIDYEGDMKEMLQNCLETTEENKAILEKMTAQKPPDYSFNFKGAPETLNKTLGPIKDLKNNWQAAGKEWQNVDDILKITGELAKMIPVAGKEIAPFIQICQFFVGCILLGETSQPKSQLDQLSEMLVRELNELKLQDTLENVQSLSGPLAQDADSAAKSLYQLQDQTTLAALYNEFNDCTARMRSVLVPLMQYLEKVQPCEDNIPADHGLLAQYPPKKFPKEQTGIPSWSHMGTLLGQLNGAVTKYLLMMDLMATGLEINGKETLAHQCREKKAHMAAKMMVTGQKVFAQFKYWGFGYGPKNDKNCHRKPDNSKIDPLAWEFGKQADRLIKLALTAGAQGSDPDQYGWWGFDDDPEEEGIF